MWLTNNVERKHRFTQIVYTFRICCISVVDKYEYYILCAYLYLEHVQAFVNMRLQKLNGFESVYENSQFGFLNNR